MIQIPQRLLSEALLRSAKENPSKTAIIVKNKEYSYLELKQSAEKLAAHLIKSGINRGDRVAVYLNNSWESIVSIYAISIAGGVFLVINPQTKANKLSYILNDSESRIIISDISLNSELLPALEETRTIEEVILSGKDEANPEGHIKFSYFETILKAENLNVQFPVIIPNDLAALIYTSGSTGFPKGVMMTHQSMVFTSWSLIQYLRLDADDRIILLLPLAFDYGLYQLLMAITIGGTLIVEQSFIFPASVYKVIEQTKPTVFPGVPTIYAMMIAANKKTGFSFGSIKKITNTAANLPADFTPDLKKIFPNALIFRMYGLTECKRVCYLEPELVDAKPTSVGKAIPGTEVFLLSPDGKPVSPGEPGILHVRGPHVMVGYWKKEDLTNEMLKPGRFPTEKILCSNDWFKMDEDGDLYFLGRNDDIIKTRGEKVSPVEIENIIHQIPGVKEAAIMGTPDEILGESIVAFITNHESAELSDSDIRRECALQLEAFMVPQKVIFIPEMPKSPNGKIDKKELKKIYLDNE
ncbi:MAG TPA: AMP-binding protein [Bacteroidales bacterium]|nr:AMP-binding protein [Bacteroidales bacterium]